MKPGIFDEIRDVVVIWTLYRSINRPVLRPGSHSKKKVNGEGIPVVVRVGGHRILKSMPLNCYGMQDAWW